LLFFISILLTGAYGYFSLSQPINSRFKSNNINQKYVYIQNEFNRVLPSQSRVVFFNLSTEDLLKDSERLGISDLNSWLSVEGHAYGKQALIFLVDKTQYAEMAPSEFQADHQIEVQFPKIGIFGILIGGNGFVTPVLLDDKKDIWKWEKTNNIWNSAAIPENFVVVSSDLNRDKFEFTLSSTLNPSQKQTYVFNIDKSDMLKEYSPQIGGQ